MSKIRLDVLKKVENWMVLVGNTVMMKYASNEKKAVKISLHYLLQAKLFLLSVWLIIQRKTLLCFSCTSECIAILNLAER